jgi:DNA-binding response OmpR family regulator
MSRLLIIEDEPAIRRGLTDAFVREGYEVAAAADGTEGDRLLREQHFDAVLLDLMLPGLSGYEVCGRMRAAGDQTPVLMLTARGEEEDRVRGLDLGADDYVTKPFSLRELSARVRALIRRAHAQPPAPENLTINGLTVDFKAYAASREGKPVEMTRREFQVLRALVAHPNAVLSRDSLLDLVLGEDVFVTNRTIDNHIVALRSKIETDPAQPRHILTVRGVGYKWTP